MALKFFFDKTTNTSVAINPQQVLFVHDSPIGCSIRMVGDRLITVTEAYLDVVARLNEV